MSCLPYVACFFRLSFFIAPSVFSNIYLSCVLCILCCQFLWIVHFYCPFGILFTFICPVSYVSYVASFSGLSIFIAPSVFSNIYLSCVLCILCCQFLWLVHFYCPFGILLHLFVLCLVYPMLPISLDCPCVLPLRYSLTFVCSVSCVPYVASFSRLPLFIALWYSLTFICSVSGVPYVANFSRLPLCIAPSVFSNICLFCVLYTLSCQFLSIALVYCPFGIL